MDETSEEVLSPDIEITGVSNTSHRSAGLWDKFVDPQAQQTTIKNRCNKEQRELVVEKNWDVPLRKWLAFQSCQ